MTCKILFCLSLLAATSAKRDQTRWSRQISSYTSDISDWVPLTGPIDREVPLQSKRQAVAEPRILSEPISELARPSDFNTDAFSSRGFFNSQGNRQLYLQSVPSVPSASQNFLNDQGFNQGFRFGLGPPNFPLNQGFVTPQYNFDTLPQFRPKPQVPANPIRFDNFPPPIQSTQPPQVKPVLNLSLKTKFEAPKYVDGYRVENNTDGRLPQKKLHPSQKIRFEDYDKPKDVFTPSKQNVEREEVQLLYVPVESLNRGQFNFRSPVSSAQLLNAELYNHNQNQLPSHQNFAAEFQRPIMKALSAESLQSPEYLSKFNSQNNGPHANKFSIPSSPFPAPAPTTTKPKKLKPHQPPLAIFLTQNAKKENDIKVGDVLTSLKSVKTVPVLDAVNPLNAPEVFIGPSSLTPPEKYVKFELPYLSNIENKDKKLKQLPFFVAPLSYNTPQGFAKIPFPSPHVGSVVINSHIQEASQSVKSSTVADVLPNSYQDPSIYRDHQTVTQKPKISYYSTVAPKENFMNNYEQNYYSFEPQTVNTVRPVKEYTNPAIQSTKLPSYFLTNIQTPYNPPQFSNFQQVPSFQNTGSIKTLNTIKSETTSTPKTTTITTKPTTTYPNQLLQTHNPFSINQAFHFSTPNDYQNNFEEYKESLATQKQTPPSSTTSVSYPSRPTINYEGKFKPSPQLSTQSYSQSYSSEVQYQPESQGAQYQKYNTNLYSTKSQSQETDYSQSVQPSNANDNIKPVELKTLQNNPYNEVPSPAYENYTDIVSAVPESPYNFAETPKDSDKYQYDSNFNSEESHTSTTTSTTTTTTTTRAPTRLRGRPRYPVNKPTDSIEHTTRTVVTRKPIRERRPLPSRTRYEPNRLSTERTTTKLSESSASSESSTRSYKSRTRGKIHFKPTQGDEIYDKQTKPSKKENDLAYQRDVLHQNYPVTLMERASTVDIEAITEPTGKIESSDNLLTTKTEDTENADSNDKPSITEHINSQLTDVSQYTSAVESDTDNYVRKVPSRGGNEYTYESKVTSSPQDKKSSYEVKEVEYSSNTTPDVTIYEQDLLDINSNRPENEPINTDSYEYSTESHAKVTLSQTEDIKITSHESLEPEQENDKVETTPSYNRVRIRPGVVRQQYQPSSTEPSRIKNERRNNYPITYRPAFDRRRTTMRIEEIEADLKTKQVHSRPEFKDYKQPVYKPDPVTELTSSTTEATTKRNQYKRKRPVYTTSSTEGTVNRRPYETKNRFRGRRPTEKPMDSESVSQTEATSSSTVKNILHNRYSRPKLSDRFNKKPEVEDTTSEDQDSNYSLHRPKYAPPDSNRWSSNLSNDSFKPYNPNNIADEVKIQNEEKVLDDELDIITAKNDNVLISVTPATNNHDNKNIQELPSTLESLVEQTKGIKNDTGETPSTFESMLEEVMKSLEEQDEDEYTSNVMKHKGGEIGEIPPEKVISSGVNYSSKFTRPLPEQTAPTLPPDSITSSNNNEEEQSRKSRRRGYWKKVKVRPATEGIDVAESQYYSDTINSLGKTISKDIIGKSTDKNKFTVTTYKPSFQFLQNFFENEDEQLDIISHVDVPKLKSTSSEIETENSKVVEQLTTESSILNHTPTDTNPGDMDLGTGSPDPTYDDTSYYSEPTEPTSTSTKVDRSDRYSFMDYLFGITSPDETEPVTNNTEASSLETTQKYQETETQTAKAKITTESVYIPDEITTETINTEHTGLDNEREKVESSSVSNLMDPKNVVSTSMSTEISHETEICFRGKCIKTNKDLL